MLNSLDINHLKFDEMTFEFFLPENGTQKNIHLKLTDTLHNKMYTFRTHLRISKEDWDKEKQRPANIYLKKHKMLNAKLNEIKKAVAEYLRVQCLKKKQPLQRVISQKIKEICTGKQVELPENSLLYYMQWYISIKNGLICDSTYKRYLVFFHLMERFEGFICKRLFVEEVDADFVKNFILFGKEEEYSESTICRTIHFVKTILNFAERKGIKTCVRELEIRREKHSKEMITLTESKITKIEQTEVPKELQSAKDWLLISCFTGQRFSDFMHFNTEQLKEINGKPAYHLFSKKPKRKFYFRYIHRF